MNSLAWRVISASIAAGLLVGSYSFFANWGLFVLCTTVVFIATYEFNNVAFTRIKAPANFQLMFLSLAFVLYSLIIFALVSEATSISVLISSFISLGLWLGSSRMPNVKLLTALTMGILGLVYCVSFPALVMKILIQHEKGLQWWLLLMIVVFSGDTGAYFGGRFFGNKKLMPQISPKKTVAGSVIGGISSGILGLVFMTFYLPEVPEWVAFLGCLFIGLFAQCGDLFVSLIKRVAEVKDSGKIMPGHGGLLDRLDGIFIACPLVYGFAVLF